MTTITLLGADELARAFPPEADDESGLGALSTEQGNLPLKLLDVSARITGLVAETRVRQTFVNTLGVPLEATYIFPLPSRAAVSRFRFEVNDRVIEGELQERGQARRAYDQAIQTGHRAAIAEEERPGVFTMRVGNLMPGEEATVHLTLSGPLPFSEGEATYRFPLVVAPRYIPGAALPGSSVGQGTALDTDAVPDASRISPPVLLPGFPNPVRLGIEVEVEGIPLSSLRSSLHAVLLEQTGERKVVRIQPGERLNRDFVLRLGLAGDAIRQELVLHPDASGEEGTFQLTLLPPKGLPASSQPRDVVFVLDRSGSMGGWKMIAARRACARLLDALDERDRFAVLAFDSRVERPTTLSSEGMISASDRNRFRAVEFLSQVEARGGTEMAEPIRQALDDLFEAERAGRERILILITDGQVGNEDQILRAHGGRLQSVRTFTLGIDRAVNEGFLQRLAELGGGGCELVESESRLDEVMDSIHRRIGAPLLTDLRLAGAPGLELIPDTLAPARLPDLFAGQPVRIAGRYRGPGGPLQVRAFSPKTGIWAEQLTPRESENPALTRVWARAQVRALEDRYAIEGGSALPEQIVALSLAHQVMCRFTAFVAVDRSEVVNEGGEQHHVTQAVEQPEGWEKSELQADPFGAASLVPHVASDPFAAPPSSAPSGFASSDPFAANGGDPFGGGDPFAAPAAEAFGGGPFAAPAADAFALPSDAAGGGFGAPAGPPPAPRGAPRRSGSKKKVKERVKREERQQRSLLGELFDKVSGRDRREPPRPSKPAPAGDDAPSQVEAIRRALAKDPSYAGLLACLGEVRRLIERLEREGSDDKLLEGLRDLRDALTAALGPGEPPLAEVSRLASDAEQKLAALAKEQPLSRGESFWF